MKHLPILAITLLLLITVIELGAINIMLKAAWNVSSPIVRMEK